MSDVNKELVRRFQEEAFSQGNLAVIELRTGTKRGPAPG